MANICAEPGGGLRGLQLSWDIACNPGAGWREPRARSGPLLPQPAADHGDIKAQLQEIEEEAEDPFDIAVRVDGDEVWVEIDPERGPRWGLKDEDFVNLRQFPGGCGNKKWKDLTLTEQELVLVQVAKKIKPLYLRMGKSLAREQRAKLEDEGEKKSPEEIAAEVKARIDFRCGMEFAKPPKEWRTIEIEDVTENHLKKAKGMMYDLEFPWTQQMLDNMGPEWLTQAFHAAGTMDRENRVTKITMDKKVKVTTGNNGGKFLFDVKYKKPDPTLHTKLFAKIPYPLEGVTRSDRLSSSVNKQPQEFYELNTNRLLEASLPCKIPRFYFGDISNETTNWILITERVLFADRASQNYGKPKPRKGPLRPFMIEGPYDKCLDYNLRGDPKQYYLLLVRTGAKMAGCYKAGLMGDPRVLSVSLANMENRPMEYWGMSFHSNSGEDPRSLRPKLENAFTFVSDTGAVLFPEYVKEEAWIEKVRNLMLTLNAYTNELNCWKHVAPDYIAIAHQNMNVDNAYFWRDGKGRLQLGVLDWGGMGSTCLGHKLWWWLYCQDFEVFRDNLSTYIDAFIDSYRESGGPQLEHGRLRSMMLISALQQLMQLFFAVPQIMKMCPKKEWATIEDRYDERISENVDGKSTLRLYLHVMNNVIRILEEMDGFEVLNQWISFGWAGEFRMAPKTWEAITSPPAGTRM